MTFFAGMVMLAQAGPPNNLQRNPIKKIVKAIAKSNVYDAGSGNIKSPSPQNIRYKKLVNLATVEELQQLILKNKKPIVRLYSFRAMVSLVNEIPKNIFNLVMNDNTEVTVIDGNKTFKKPLNSIAKGFLY